MRSKLKKVVVKRNKVFQKKVKLQGKGHKIKKEKKKVFSQRIHM